MIRPDRQENAIRSLHGIFVWLRALAQQKADHELIAKACDLAEILPTYFGRKEDLTDDFRQMLVELRTVHPGFGLALEFFDGRAQ